MVVTYANINDWNAFSTLLYFNLGELLQVWDDEIYTDSQQQIDTFAVQLIDGDKADSDEDMSENEQWTKLLKPKIAKNGMWCEKSR